MTTRHLVSTHPQTCIIFFLVSTVNDAYALYSSTLHYHHHHNKRLAAKTTRFDVKNNHNHLCLRVVSHRSTSRQLLSLVLSVNVHEFLITLYHSAISSCSLIHMPDGAITTQHKPAIKSWLLKVLLAVANYY